MIYIQGTKDCGGDYVASLGERCPPPI